MRQTQSFFDFSNLRLSTTESQLFTEENQSLNLVCHLKVMGTKFGDPD